MGWDELYIFCGVAPRGGSSDMTHDLCIKSDVKDIHQDIRKEGLLPNFTDDKIMDIVHETLDYVIHSPKTKSGYPLWIPQDTTEPNRDCVTVGHFDIEGRPIIKETKVPNRRNVQTFIAKHDDRGCFDGPLENDGFVEFYKYLVCSARNLFLSVLRPCPSQENYTR